MMKKTFLSALRQTATARRTAGTIIRQRQQQQRCWSSTTTTGSNTNNDVAVSPESRLVTSKDGVAGRPIDFDVQSKIEGNESQIVTITLEPGQVLRAESGGM